VKSRYLVVFACTAAFGLACGPDAKPGAVVAAPAAQDAGASAPKTCAERSANDSAAADDAALSRLAGRAVTGVCVLGVAPAAFPTLDRLAERRRGERFDPAKVTIDLEAMFATDLISDARAHAEPAADGVTLVYIVKLRPEIRSVRVSGNTVIDAARVAKLLAVSEKSRLDPSRLQAGLAAIEEAYRDEGYPDAKAQHALKVEGDVADLQVSIREGSVVKISRVAFTGLKVLKESDLRPLLGFSVGDPLRTPRIEDASIKLSVACMDVGLLSCALKTPRIEMEKGGATVEFVFEEGPQFILKAISLAGDLAEPEAQLRKIMRAQVGKPVSRKVLMDDLERLKQRLGNAEIEPEFSLDQAKKTASLTLRIKRK